MHCVRVPLATIGNQQPSLKLSPLKGLSLADKENTVSTLGPRRGGGYLWDLGTPLTACLPACLPAATRPQRHPRAGQQGGPQDLPGGGGVRGAGEPETRGRRQRRGRGQRRLGATAVLPALSLAPRFSLSVYLLVNPTASGPVLGSRPFSRYRSFKFPRGWIRV